MAAEASQFITVTPGNEYKAAEVKMMDLSPLTAGVDQALTTIELAFRYVPWFRRACKLRANAIGRFPLTLENAAGDDVSEKPEYQAVVLWTRKLLYRVEMNLVKYGAAYHLIETNRFNLNATPRFIPTPAVYPIIDYTEKGLTGFQVSFFGGVSGTFPLDRMVYLWEPNDENEIRPGPSDGGAALKASGLLYAIDEMANRYMGSGGVPVTAVRVPPTMDREERTKTETFMQRMFGGFRNAFKFLVVDKGTEFETIGSEMKDLQAVELTGAQRDNVAVAIGVPPTVIDGKSANYATADSEMTGFYMNTVMPQAEQIEPELNTQLYQRLGLTLRFQPDELEVMQLLQGKQAESVAALVGKPILSIDEGRAIIEYDSLPGGLGEWKEPPPPPAPFGGPAASGGSPIEQAQPAASGGTDTMRSWLAQSLAQFKAGSLATVGAPFDAQLAGASSNNMIRSIYTANWPRPQSAAHNWTDRHERALVALENYNALAGKE